MDDLDLIEADGIVRRGKSNGIKDDEIAEDIFEFFKERHDVGVIDEYLRRKGLPPIAFARLERR